MGINNKQRRAAKQRKRGQRPRTNGRPEHEAPSSWADQGWRDFGAFERVDLLLTRTVRRIAQQRVGADELDARAAELERSIAPAPRVVLETVLRDVLARVLEPVVEGGWGRADLTELVRRCAGPEHVATITALLDRDAHRPRLATTAELASALQVAALLSTTPLLHESAAHRSTGAAERPAEHPKLARVRALLAKAESTDFDEEAEALTAKAQELITRYALGRLVDGEQPGGRPSEGPQVRRLWLDAPYVRAKAALVASVADANRCRSACAERFGFCVLVGDTTDLDFVELLVTSLLVQADAAMLRLGRRNDGSGASRTRSFRRSFLFAYAARIGDRLQAAVDDAITDQHDDRLLPVLRDQEARVSEAFEAMVPHTTGRGTSISNGEGWVAGLAAADLALLDVRGKLADQAG